MEAPARERSGDGLAGSMGIGGGAFLARELVDALIADDLEPVCGIEQQDGVGGAR